MLPPLTKRQKEVLDFVENTTVLKGYAPSLEEIRSHFKLKAISTVHEHLENLKRKGYIDKEMNQARGIVVKDIEEDKPLEILIKGEIRQSGIRNTLLEKKVFFKKIEDVSEKCLHAFVIKDTCWKKASILQDDVVIIAVQAKCKKEEFVLFDKPECSFKKYKDKLKTEKLYGVVVGIVRTY